MVCWVVIGGNMLPLFWSRGLVNLLNPVVHVNVEPSGTIVDVAKYHLTVGVVLNAVELQIHFFQYHIRYLDGKHCGTEFQSRNRKVRFWGELGLSEDEADFYVTSVVGYLDVGHD